MASTLGSVLKLEFIPVIKHQALVNVNGQKYQFTILKDTADITQNRDWAELASHVAEFFLKDTGKSSIETGEFVVSGDFEDIETTFVEKTVSFISSTVQYKEGTEIREKVLQNGSISGASKKRVDEHLNIIGKDFASIQPVSSFPLNPIVRPTPLPTSDDLIEVDASGQCADSSLAYEILSIAGKTDSDVYVGAEYLGMRRQKS